MNAIMKLEATVILTCAISFCSTSATAWWNDDDDHYYDRWHGGPWYGRYHGYGYDWGGYPGYPGYGWGGYPYRQDKTIIVLPKKSTAGSKAPDTRIPE